MIKKMSKWLVWTGAGCALVLLPNVQFVFAQDTSVRDLVGAYNTSGQQLFKRFAASRGNIVFSPYSIGTVMAMALSGARGETAAEMAGVLKQRLPREQMDAANASLLMVLKSYDKSAVTPTCLESMRWTGLRCESAPTATGTCPSSARLVGDHCEANPISREPSAQLRMANALVQSKARRMVAEDYRTLLAAKYAAEAFEAAGVNEVNDWVKRKTEGKIDKIIDQLPDVVLLNAIYFKARWQLTFNKDLTGPKPFNLSSSRKVMVPTMANTDQFSVVVRPGYRAIQLPYEVSELSMIIVLPNELNGVERIGNKIDAKELSQLLQALRAVPSKLVQLELPRFKVSYDPGDLTSVFQHAGMRRAFDRNKADFSGITGHPASELPLWIEVIRHRAVIEVMEDGTEAAAVTALGIKAASIQLQPPKPEPFRVDHPFLFYIMDDATGAVLFQGRVTDPQ